MYMYVHVRICVCSHTDLPIARGFTLCGSTPPSTAQPEAPDGRYKKKAEEKDRWFLK